jgi:hypothetical protein
MFVNNSVLLLVKNNFSTILVLLNFTKSNYQYLVFTHIQINLKLRKEIHFINRFNNLIAL